MVKRLLFFLEGLLHCNLQDWEIMKQVSVLELYQWEWEWEVTAHTIFTETQSGIGKSTRLIIPN